MHNSAYTLKQDTSHVVSSNKIKVNNDMAGSSSVFFLNTDQGRASGPKRFCVIYSTASVSSTTKGDIFFLQYYLRNVFKSRLGHWEVYSKD